MANRPTSAREKSVCNACAPKPIVAVTSCHGCSQNFCRKHFNEHRDQLSIDLQTVFGQHDSLLEELQVQLDRSSNPLNTGPAVDLLKRIADWKKATIANVTRAADETSAHVQRLFSRTQDLDQLKKRVDEITKELKVQQESESFVETDIDRWMEHLKGIQTDLSQPPLIHRNPPRLQISEIDWNTIIQVSNRQDPSTQSAASVRNQTHPGMLYSMIRDCLLNTSSRDPIINYLIL